VREWTEEASAIGPAVYLNAGLMPPNFELSWPLFRTLVSGMPHLFFGFLDTITHIFRY
jgi:hypothetical protein